MNRYYTLGRGLPVHKSASMFAILVGVILCTSVEARAQNIRYDVKIEKQYFLGDQMPVVFSMTNIGPRVAKVKDAGMLKISVELKGPVNGEKVEVQKYTYDGRKGVPVIPPSHEGPGGDTLWYAPTFVKKPPVELRTGQSTSQKFDDLLELFSIEKGVAPGVYTLTVWFDDREQVTKKFRVELDGETTFERLWQMLKSEDETTMRWASSYLFRFYEQRVISLIRRISESGNESERNWALKVMSTQGHIKW